MKKVLSLVLVIAMVLSSMSFAFAGTFEDVTGDYEEAVDALVALGVIKGYPDGTFKPERTLTRAELAVLLVQSLGYDDLVTGSTSNFSDTQNHWSNGYVAIAAGTGLVQGYPDGSFKPDNGVSYDEAITMVLRAIGYVDSALKGTWPTNFKVKAIDLDLLDDVNMATAAADRGGVAQILFNALELPMVELGEENVLVKVSPEKLFIDNIAKAKTIVVDEDYLDPDHKDYAGDVVDLAPYMYQTLNVYMNDAKDVVYIKDSDSIVIEGTVDSKTASAFVVKDADGDKYTIPFAGTEYMFYNGAEISTAVDIDDISTAFEKITVVGLETETVGNDNNKLDLEVELAGLVVLEQTKVARIDDEYVDGKDNVDVFDLPTDDGDVDLTKVTVKGAVESLEDIEVDDVVVEYLAKDDSVTTLVVSRETVEGKVTRITTGTSADSYYIDGVKYTESKLVTLGLSVTDEGTFFLDHNGKLVDFEGASAGPTDYAVIVDSENGDRIDRFGYSVDTYPQVKLATQDGEEVVLDVYVDVTSAGAVDTDEVATINNDTTYLVVNGTGDALNIANLPAVGTIVKYSLNKDGQLEELETVAEVDLVNVETEDLKFADEVIVFDSSDDYAVVDVEKLEADLAAVTVVYDDNGLIEVVLTSEVEDSTSTTYAFLDAYDVAYDGTDKVQLATVIMNGEKVEVYTDSELLASTDLNKVFALDFDGDVLIDEDAVVAVPNTTTATAISVKSNMIQFASAVNYEGGSTAIAAGTWLPVAEDVTIMTVESDGDFDELADLYDIDENETSIEVYLNADKEVVFIIIK